MLLVGCSTYAADRLRLYCHLPSKTLSRGSHYKLHQGLSATYNLYNPTPPPLTHSVFSCREKKGFNNNLCPYNMSVKATLSPRSSTESLQSNYSALSSPDKLAPAVTGPMVWEGSELDPAKYIVELDQREIQDIRAAVIKVKSKHTACEYAGKNTHSLT